MSLQLDIYLALVEDITQQEVEQHEIDGIGKRCPLGMEDDAMDSVEHPFAHAKIIEHDGKHLAGDIQEQGIDAKDMEKATPSLFAANVYDIHQHPLQQGCQPTCHEHITGAPYTLVERQEE